MGECVYWRIKNKGAAPEEKARIFDAVRDMIPALAPHLEKYDFISGAGGVGAPDISFSPPAIGFNNAFLGEGDMEPFWFGINDRTTDNTLAKDDDLLMSKAKTDSKSYLVPILETIFRAAGTFHKEGIPFEFDCDHLSGFKTMRETRNMRYFAQGAIILGKHLSETDDISLFSVPRKMTPFDYFLFSDHAPDKFDLIGAGNTMKNISALPVSDMFHPEHFIRFAKSRTNPVFCLTDPVTGKPVTENKDEFIEHTVNSFAHIAKGLTVGEAIAAFPPAFIEGWSIDARHQDGTSFVTGNSLVVGAGEFAKKIPEISRERAIKECRDFDFLSLGARLQAEYESRSLLNKTQVRDAARKNSDFL